MGFTLYGPQYCFTNSVFMGFCCGFSCSIDAATEDHLLSKEVFVLDIHSDLPDGKGDELLLAHHGNTKYMVLYGDMSYRAIKIPTPPTDAELLAIHALWEQHIKSTL